jgi:hypothetical protein
MPPETFSQRRAKFRANQYHYPSNFFKDEHRNGNSSSSSEESDNSVGEKGKKPSRWMRGFKNKKRTSVDGPWSDDANADFSTDVLEVWFAGCHSGMRNNDELCSLC